jgi:hypothetical protein
MAHKHLKTSAMAAIVLGCLLGVAQATGPSPPPIDPSQLRTLHNLLQPKPGVPLPQTGVGRLTPGPSFTLGWNRETCREILYFSTGSIFYYIVLNTDGSFVYDNNISRELSTIQSQLLAACTHAAAGGSYLVHILNTESLAFDAIVINYGL